MVNMASVEGQVVVLTQVGSKDSPVMGLSAQSILKNRLPFMYFSLMISLMAKTSS